MRTVNATAIRVYWDPPFTPVGFDILFYSVSVVNASDGASRMTPPLLNTSYVLSTDGGRILENCYEIRFYVCAWSEVGQSRNGSVSGTFPTGNLMIVHCVLIFIFISMFTRIRIATVNNCYVTIILLFIYFCQNGLCIIYNCGLHGQHDVNSFSSYTRCL